MTDTATEKPAKKTEANRFDFMGETLEVDSALGYPLIAKYREAALALHAAKARAFEIEEEVKELMQGYEYLLVNGERIFRWTWGMKTTFDKSGLHNKYPQIHDEFVVKTPNGTRSFGAPGVSGVD